MFPIVVTKALVAASANNIALSQTPTSGSPITLNGSTATAGVATLDTQRQVLVTFGSEGGARTILFTGTNNTGGVLTETIAIPSGSPGTVATLQSFFKVTSAIAGGGGFTTNVTIGTNSVGSTDWISITPQITPGNVQAVVAVISGAATFEVEWTNDNINPVGLYPWHIPIANTLSMMNNAGSVNWPITGIRLTNLTGAGTTQATFLQAGVGQWG